MGNTVYILKGTENDKIALSKKAYDFVNSFAQRKFGTVEGLEMVTLENGKPYFKNYPDFHFNISHSKLFLAIAFSDSPVGVDIEEIRDVNLQIANRYFSENERQFVKDIESFFYVWTRKEAYLKRTGDGLRTCLSALDVLDDKNIKTFNMKDYIVSVCSDHAEDFTLITEENFCGRP